MVVRPEQEQMQMLLTEAITVLCKNGLNYHTRFSVEGLLGITLDDEDVFLVNIKQTVRDEPEVDVAIKKDFEKLKSRSPMSRAKQRKMKQRSFRNLDRLQEGKMLSTGMKSEGNREESSAVYSTLCTNGNDDMHEDMAWRNSEQSREQDFDDNVSSPGEVIVVKEESLSDAEASLTSNNNQNEAKPIAHSNESANYDSEKNNMGQIYAAGTTQSATGQVVEPPTSVYSGWPVYPQSSTASGPPSHAQVASHEPQYQSSENEPDDTACLKAAYATDGPILSVISGSSTTTLSSRQQQQQQQRKRTLDSVVKHLHFNKKKKDDSENEASANEAPSDESIKEKSFNNNNLIIDSANFQVKVQRKKGPFGKKRLTEIVDANANSQLYIKTDIAQDLSYNTSLLNTPTSNGDATCHICNKVLSTRASYKRHMNFHQGIYPHRCSKCGKGFAVKGDLRGHEATHTNEKEFPCPCCDRVFAYKKNLQMHTRKKHQIITGLDVDKCENLNMKMDDNLGYA